MHWASAASEHRDTRRALDEALAGVAQQLAGRRPDLAFLFASREHVAGEETQLAAAGDRLGAAVIVGCAARSVIGAGKEMEERPALSVTAAVLPGVAVQPLRLGSGGEAADLGLSGDGQPPPHFVLLADPFSGDPQALVSELDAAFPGSTKIGGLASGAEGPGQNTLFLQGRVYRDGLVGVGLQGALALDAVVAQGCRPIGHPLFVTRHRGPWILELDGRPPIEVLKALFEEAPERDRELMQSSLFLGIEMRPDLSSYGAGDFLVRNLLGVDPKARAIAVGAPLREGLVVQFHLRDAESSAQDLERRLSHYAAQTGASGSARGALLFSCLGRGAQLYGRPDHDSLAFRRHLGPLPLGGFFCNGEIGPVERRTFLHGYTSAFGIFREP
jgi:small ligand-binding sensory domain FIST